MGQSFCKDIPGRSSYFDNLASGGLPQNNSDESINYRRLLDSGDIKKATSNEVFLNASQKSLRWPKSEGRQSVNNSIERDEHNDFKHLELKSSSSLKHRIQLEGNRREMSKRICHTKLISALEKRRNTQLCCVTRMAEAALWKGNRFLGELEAQRDANWESRDYRLKTEEDLDEIRGMMSIRGKLHYVGSNTSTDLRDGAFSEELDSGRERRSSLPGVLPSFFDSDRQYSKRFELGVKKLYTALDTLHKQQKTLKYELEMDKKPPDEDDSDLGRVDAVIMR